MTRRPAGIITAVAMVLVLSGCAVDRPTFEGETTLSPTTAAAAEPTTVPQFLPTTAPEPEPTASAQTSPTSTVVPSPTPTPPSLPSPPLLEPVDPSVTLEPVLVQAGPVAVPVGTTTFILASPRPILQLAGHTLIYLDDDRQAEVDIFTPVATGDGTPLIGYDDVIDVVQQTPAFAEVDELDPVTIDGLPTRVFEGSAQVGERVFHTDLGSIGVERAGWFPPVRVRMWIMDGPSGTVVVSAESLADPGQYSDAVRLATEVLSTITTR